MAPHNVVLEAASDRAFKMYETAGFRGLAADDQILVAIWALEADVNNGGYEQFYFNASGDLAAQAASALRTIGAVRMASIVEAASGRFGPAGPSGDRGVRQRQLRRLVGSSDDMFEDLDRKFYEYPDDIAARLAAHLAREPPGAGRSHDATTTRRAELRSILASDERWGSGRPAAEPRLRALPWAGGKLGLCSGWTSRVTSWENSAAPSGQKPGDG